MVLKPVKPFGLSVCILLVDLSFKLFVLLFVTLGVREALTHSDLDLSKSSEVIHVTAITCYKFLLLKLERQTDSATFHLNSVLG